MNQYYYHPYIGWNGKQVERTKEDYPYSYDSYFVWKNNFNRESDSVVYSDRLFQWDSKKYNQCCKEIWNNEGQYFSNRNSQEIERFLSLYFEKEIKLTAILEGCNVSNGYPFWVFCFEK